MTYGNFRWWSNWDFALDPNAISFIVPHLCYILKHRGAQMPPELAARLRTSLRLSVDGLNAHRATWGYTNIALLNLASKIMIADVMDDPRAEKLAYWDWEEWRNHTARLATITEYNTVCYTGVQIDAFALMLACRADPRFLREIRAAMRQLIAASVMDFHPGAGRITGAQSRAYPPDRRLRGASLMDTILHFVLRTPAPEKGCTMWLGAPLGPDDLLPAARNLPLPRETRCATHGHVRYNYLADDFALGHLSGRNHWSGTTVPFYLAHRSRTPRCGIPVMQTPAQAEGYFAVQHEGRLLAATLWMADRAADGRPASGDTSFGSLSGLCTGQPDNLISDSAAQPGYDVELGLPPDIRLLNGEGRELPAGAQVLPGTVLVIETESIRAGFRFWCSAEQAAPVLSLAVEPDGETVLQVRAPRQGIHLNPLEEGCCVAFYLDVASRSEPGDSAELARRLAALDLGATASQAGWTLTVKAAPKPLTLVIDAAPAQMYGVAPNGISANQWVRNLAGAVGDVTPR
jgi:hypothetical protein